MDAGLPAGSGRAAGRGARVHRRAVRGRGRRRPPVPAGQAVRAFRRATGRVRGPARDGPRQGRHRRPVRRRRRRQRVDRRRQPGDVFGARRTVVAVGGGPAADRRRRRRPAAAAAARVQLEVSVRVRVHRRRRRGKHTRVPGHMSGQAAAERHQLLPTVVGHCRPARVSIRHATRSHTGILR